MVHRDLEPGNVTLTRSGPGLLDFGLARSRAGAREDEATQTRTLTRTGVLLGTVP